jgi:23S rRNA (adenine2030-N6)-methyltransferase
LDRRRRAGAAHRRFATGTFLLWYPVINRVRTEALLAKLRETGVARQLGLELCVRPDAAGRGMTGAGMLVVYPPWTLAEAATSGLPWLARTLDAAGHWQVAWNMPP